MAELVSLISSKAWCEVKSIVLGILFPPATSMQEVKSPESRNDSIRLLLLLHLTCVLGLALAFWAALDFCSLVLIQNPSQTLFIVWVCKPPHIPTFSLLEFCGNLFCFCALFQAVLALVVIPVFSRFRIDPDQCSVISFLFPYCLYFSAFVFKFLLNSIVFCFFPVC